MPVQALQVSIDLEFDARLRNTEPDAGRSAPTSI